MTGVLPHPAADTRASTTLAAPGESGTGRKELADTGTLRLATLPRFPEMPADPRQLRHQYGESGQHGEPGRPMTAEMLLRAARRPGLKARIVRRAWRKLGATPLPAIVEFKDGRFVPAGGFGNGGLRSRNRAKAVGRTDFEERG